MEYFVDAKINFKGDYDIDIVDKAIKDSFEKEDFRFDEDCYGLDTNEDKLVVILERNFEFEWVESLVEAVKSTGLKKFGEDRLIAYQTCADVYFENYVTEEGYFLDYCGDCDY